MGDVLFRIVTGGEGLPAGYHGSNGPRLSPTKLPTYLLYMGHDPGLCLNVQLFDSFDKFLFPLTLWRVTSVNETVLQGQPRAARATEIVSKGDTYPIPGFFFYNQECSALLPASPLTLRFL